MRPSPLLTALGAGAGTLVVLGGSTFLLSGMVLQVTKHVVRHRKVWAAAVAASVGPGTAFGEALLAAHTAGLHRLDAALCLLLHRWCPTAARCAVPCADGGGAAVQPVQRQRLRGLPNLHG